MWNRIQPGQKRQFTIQFGEGQFSPAVYLKPDARPEEVIRSFGLQVPRPVIFIIGGAGDMSNEDIKRTRIIIEQGIAAFAEKHGITVVDGGTESGVMHMIGEARAANRYRFPLIGIAPIGKVSFPGKEAQASEAQLQDDHSHFVLVDADEWGDESQMIIDLTRALSAGEMPAIGILINGGQIAEKEIFLATTQGEDPIPMLILEGSGRKADEVGIAFRTGKTNNDIIRAIIAGGKIMLTSISDGPAAMTRQLETYFSGEHE